jgi:hypothetical protein
LWLEKLDPSQNSLPLFEKFARSSQVAAAEGVNKHSTRHFCSASTRNICCGVSLQRQSWRRQLTSGLKRVALSARARLLHSGTWFCIGPMAKANASITCQKHPLMTPGSCSRSRLPSQVRRTNWGGALDTDCRRGCSSVEHCAQGRTGQSARDTDAVREGEDQRDTIPARY